MAAPHKARGNTTMAWSRGVGAGAVGAGREAVDNLRREMADKVRFEFVKC